jgi:hypothetical protein
MVMRTAITHPLIADAVSMRVLAAAHAFCCALPERRLQRDRDSGARSLRTPIRSLAKARATARAFARAEDRTT